MMKSRTSKPRASLINSNPPALSKSAITNKLRGMESDSTKKHTLQLEESGKKRKDKANLDICMLTKKPAVVLS